MKISIQQIRLTIHTVGTLGIVAMLIASFTLVLRPADVQRAQATAQMAASRKLIESRHTIIADAEVADCERFALQQRLQELKALVPTRPEESSFLSQMSALAKECELDIRKFVPGTTEPGEHINRIRVQLDGAGSYDCICLFLDGLQGLPRLTQVSKLHITPEKDSAAYAVAMELSIFYTAREEVAASQEGGRQ